MAPQPEITLGGIVQSVFNQKFFFVSITLLGLIATAAAYVLLEKQYESEGRLFIQLGRSSVGLDPTATASGTISVMDSRETEIRSVVDLMSSRGVIEEVVKRIGPAEILKSKFDDLPFPKISTEWLGLSSGAKTVETEFSAGRSAQEQRDFEAAVKKFSDDMFFVSAEKKTAVVSVYCKASSPELAKRLADMVLDVTREMYLKISYVNESEPFFESGFELQNDRLESLEQELESFLNERNVLSIDAQRNLTQEIINRLSNRIVDTQSEIIELDTELKGLSEQLSSTEEFFVLESKGMESLSRSGADQKLIELKGNLATLMKRYNDDNFKVTQLKNEIAEVEKQVNDRQEKRSESVRQKNLVYESLEIAIAQKEAAKSGKEQLFSHLQTELDSRNALMAALNNDQRKVDALKRSIDISRTAVFDYADKLRQSRVLAELNRQQISNVEIASAGSYVTKHIAPKATLLFPIGLAGSLALASLLSVIRDRKPPSVSPVAEVERSLGVPVLVSLPRVPVAVRN